MLKKYTSYAWIKRTKEALEIFTDGYERRTATLGGSSWWWDNLQGLRMSLEGYATALEHFEKGDLTKARHSLLKGILFTNWLEDPRAEITEKHIGIGYRVPPKKNVGLYAFGGLALEMAFRTKIFFSGGHRFPDILDNASIPENIADLIDPLSPISPDLVDHGQELHTTGIWLPISHPFGCPAYQVAGDFPAPIEVPFIKILTWSSQEDIKN